MNNPGVYRRHHGTAPAEVHIKQSHTNHITAASEGCWQHQCFVPSSPKSAATPLFDIYHDDSLCTDPRGLQVIC
eukprot:2315934-Amphidinium_carterae.1